jgi:hypothetical protein
VNREKLLIGATALFSGPIVDARDPMRASRASQETARLAEVIWNQLDVDSRVAVWADRHDGLVYAFEQESIGAGDLLHHAGALVSAALEAMAAGADRPAVAWCWELVRETCARFDMTRQAEGLPVLFGPWSERLRVALLTGGVDGDDRVDLDDARQIVNQALADIGRAVLSINDTATTDA